ncbi:hypothetical protein BDQ17DRAFT_967115 [Cyathus striatus]|nr:hypothetical protein BDQ17DRAFT_967115 [Cyathus striatus]
MHSSMMSVLPSATLEIAAIALEHMQIVNYVRAATLTFLGYEYLLTFDLEVNFIWKSNWNIMKMLFIFTRYIPFFVATMGLALQFLPRASAEKCKMLYTTAALLSTWIFIAEAIFSLRTWVVCGGGQKKLGILLALIYIGVLSAHILLACIFNVVTARFDLQDTILQGCLVTKGSYYLIIIDWSLILAYDTVNMVLLMTPAYQSFRLGYYSNLAQVVLHDGLIYYFYLFVTTLANIIILIKLNHDYFTVLLILGQQMHSILACRVVLHAREEGSKAYGGSISIALTNLRFT